MGFIKKSNFVIFKSMVFVVCKIVEILIFIVVICLVIFKIGVFEKKIF